MHPESQAGTQAGPLPGARALSLAFPEVSSDVNFGLIYGLILLSIHSWVRGAGGMRVWAKSINLMHVNN